MNSQYAQSPDSGVKRTIICQFRREFGQIFHLRGSNVCLFAAFQPNMTRIWMRLVEFVAAEARMCYNCGNMGPDTAVKPRLFRRKGQSLIRSSERIGISIAVQLPDFR
jgi:hypothetical protein